MKKVALAVGCGALWVSTLTGCKQIAEARKAAEEVADYNERIGRIERDLSVLKWMVGTNIMLTVAVLGRMLFVP